MLFATSIIVLLLFVACEKQEIDIVPGSLYCVTTTEGEGFLLFDDTPDDRWTGTYYHPKKGKGNSFG